MSSSELEAVATPKVSIVIPSYNAAPFLSRAVASCTRSGYSHLQILIVNDGSGDDTARVADDLASSDPRIAAIHQQNRGVSQARNAALELVTGDYVVLLDADDELRSPWLTVAVDALERDRALDGAFGATYSIHDDMRGAITKKKTPQTLDVTSLLDANRVPVSALVLRTALYRQVGPFDPDYPTHEDWQYWLRAAHAGWHLRRIECNSCIVHVHTRNTSGNLYKMAAGQLACLKWVERHLKLRAEEVQALHRTRAVVGFFMQLERLYQWESWEQKAPEEQLRLLLQPLTELPFFYRRNLSFTVVKLWLLLLLSVAQLMKLLKIPRILKLRYVLWPIHRLSPQRAR